MGRRRHMNTKRYVFPNVFKKRNLTATPLIRIPEYDQSNETFTELDATSMISGFPQNYTLINSRNFPKSNLNQLEETNTDIDFSLFVTGIFDVNENLIVKRIGCTTSNLMITVLQDQFAKP